MLAKNLHFLFILINNFICNLFVNKATLANSLQRICIQLLFMYYILPYCWTISWTIILKGFSAKSLFFRFLFVYLILSMDWITFEPTSHKKWFFPCVPISIWCSLDNGIYEKTIQVLNLHLYESVKCMNNWLSRHPIFMILVLVTN